MSPTDPELKQIFRVVFSIVSNGRENNTLKCVSALHDPCRCKMAYSCITPRLVRYQAAKELGLPKDALEVPEYKEILKCAINDAMVCAFLSLVPGSALTMVLCSPNIAPALRTVTRSMCEQIQG